MTMRAFFTALALVAGLILSGGLSLAGEPVRIGAVVHSGGGFGSVDVSALRGMELAVKLANDRGGVLGRSVVLEPCEITSLTGADGKLGRVLERFGNRLSALASGLDSDFAMAAAPPAMDAEIPFVSAGAGLGDLATMFGPYFFSLAATDKTQAAAAARFAMDSLGASSCYILTDKGHDFTRALADYFRQAWTGLGGVVSGEAWFQSGPGGLDGRLSGLKKVAGSTDVVFIASVPADAARSCAAMRKAGTGLPILSGSGFDTPLMTGLSQDADHDIYYVADVCYQNPSPEVQSFVRAYAGVFGSDPESGFAALGFDAVNFILAAVARAGSADPVAVRKGLAEIRSFRGAAGTAVFPRGDRSAERSVSVLSRQEGQAQFVQELRP